MSAPTIKYDKKHCKIYHHPDINAVHMQWHGFAGPDEFAEACDFALDVLVSCGSGKLIADNREAKVVSQDNQKWLGEVWFPKAYKQGYRVSAVIESENILNKMSVKNIVQSMEQGKFEVQYFKDVEEARLWLEKI